MLNYSNCGKVGEAFTVRPSVFELAVLEYVPILDPGEFGVKDAIFNARDYYITSGDVINKTKVLICDLRLRLEQAATSELQAAISVRIVGAERMLGDLLLVRGSSVFLEAEHNDRKLLVIPKNPRSCESD